MKSNIPSGTRTYLCIHLKLEGLVPHELKQSECVNAIIHIQHKKQKTCKLLVRVHSRSRGSQHLFGLLRHCLGAFTRALLEAGIVLFLCSHLLNIVLLML